MIELNDVTNNEPELVSLPAPAAGFFIKYWKLWVFGGLIVALAATYYIQKLRIDHYKNLYDAAKNEIVVLKGNVDTLKYAIEDQNAKINKAAEDGKKTQEEINDLNAQIKKQEKTNKILVDKLKKQPAPNGCKESLDYLNKILDGISWEK